MSPQPDPRLEQALLEAYLERQEALESTGDIPRSASILARRARWLGWAGAIEVGFLVGSLTALAVVVIVNLLFHLQA